MSSLKIDIVTAERVVYSAEVDAVMLPAWKGSWAYCPTMPP